MNRELLHGIREAIRAAEALGFTWDQWTHAVARPDYAATVAKLPCTRTAACVHVLAGLHGLN